ncbi:post-GPI attachment to proteins factor 3, partial [Tremellales sp. Uapishka_1]
MTLLTTRNVVLLSLLLLAVAVPVLSSSGDRNPTFQHCLKGCLASSCPAPPHPPKRLPWYLSALGWTCSDNCAYYCSHSFTNNIRPGSRYHQFYGKWVFYRLGGIQEPFSVLMSLGNLYVNLQGLVEIRRRVRRENRLRRWLEVFSVIQINTWIWSTVFHSRDTPTTERLDYFSATLTISLTLLYACLRIPLFITPLRFSRLALPAIGLIFFLIITHFTYLLSFPEGSFPYAYHTTFNLILGLSHNLLWVLFSLNFVLRLPFPFPNPYPPN